MYIRLSVENGDFRSKSVCRGSISRIEDYSRTVTDIELFAIAEVLKIDVKELYQG